MGKSELTTLHVHSNRTQVGQATSAERDALVKVCYGNNAIGSTLTLYSQEWTSNNLFRDEEAMPFSLEILEFRDKFCCQSYDLQNIIKYLFAWASEIQVSSDTSLWRFFYYNEAQALYFLLKFPKAFFFVCNTKFQKNTMKYSLFIRKSGWKLAGASAPKKV